MFCDHCKYRIESKKIMDIHNRTFHDKDAKYNCALWQNLVTKGCLPLKLIILPRSFSIKSCCHQSLSIVGYLFLKIVSYLWSSSIKGCLPYKFVLHGGSSFIKGHLPLNVVLHLRLSSINGYFQFKYYPGGCWVGGSNGIKTNLSPAELG